MYVVMKGGKFVAKSGRSSSSYTDVPENAQTYETEEEARRDCCGNEHVMWLTPMHLSHVPKNKEEQSCDNDT